VRRKLEMKNIGAEQMKGELIMKGNLMSPMKDFMSLDPFRLFPNRMEGLMEEPLLRGTEEWPLKAWVPT